jgi:hypothetical protein
MASCSNSGAAPEPAVATTQTTAATFGFIPRDEVIERIATERCQREEACHNVGADGTFATSDVCIREIGETERRRLQTGDCVRGSTRSDLDGCLTSIRDERCQNDADTKRRLERCSGDYLCR